MKQRQQLLLQGLHPSRAGGRWFSGWAGSRPGRGLDAGQRGRGRARWRPHLLQGLKRERAGVRACCEPGAPAPVRLGSPLSLRLVRVAPLRLGGACARGGVGACRCSPALTLPRRFPWPRVPSAGPADSARPLGVVTLIAGGVGWGGVGTLGKGAVLPNCCNPTSGDFFVLLFGGFRANFRLKYYNAGSPAATSLRAATADCNRVGPTWLSRLVSRVASQLKC